MSKKKYSSDLIYDDYVPTYGFNVGNDYSSHLKLILILKYLKNEDVVLDAGCANGLYSFPISSYCKEVQGIDINERFLRLANEKKNENNITNVHFDFGDLTNIPYKAEVFDFVFSYSCLVLVENMQNAITECIRVVKENGYVILDITGKYNLTQVFWRRYFKNKGHFNFNAIAYSAIKNFCEENNLKVLETHALGFLDQWRYLPIISRFANKFPFIDKILHSTKSFDLDYIVSNKKFLRPFASRWYIVCQKI